MSTKNHIYFYIYVVFCGFCLFIKKQGKLLRLPVLHFLSARYMVNYWQPQSNLQIFCRGIWYDSTTAKGEKYEKEMVCDPFISRSVPEYDAGGGQQLRCRCQYEGRPRQSLLFRLFKPKTCCFFLTAMAMTLWILTATRCRNFFYHRWSAANLICTLMTFPATKLKNLKEALSERPLPACIILSKSIKSVSFRRIPEEDPTQSGSIKGKN